MRALAVIDGEHYPDVVRVAFVSMPYDVVGAVFVGGTEKLRGDEDYGVPLYATLEEGIDAADVEAVVDLSDEPILDPRGRFALASRALAAGLSYIGADFRIFVLHHHLLPVPGTGRERNVVYDAGDALEALQRAGVNLVLSGHKHVPYAWRLENIFIVNAGTVSSLRLRGNTRPCYNLIEIEGSHVDVWRKYPYHDQERIIQFSAETLEFEKYTTRIEHEVTSRP